MRNILGSLPLVAAFAVSLATTVAPTDARAADPVVMKLAHVVNPGSPRDRILHLFAQNLEKRTEGRIKAQVYPSAQLGGNKQIIEGIQSGTIQGTIGPTAFMGGFIPLLTVLDLPMLFSSLDQVAKVANGDVGADLIKVAESKGLRGLAFFPEGTKNLVTNFRVDSLADLNGRRMRVTPAPVLLEQFRAFGANPTPSELSETYSALQNGTVEGQEQQWGLVNDLKFYEVSKHLAETDHGMLVEFFFVSKRWFDKLPKDLQTAIVDEAKALIPARLEMARAYNADALAKLKAAKGVDFHVASAKLRQELTQASKPVYEWFGKTYGPQGAELIQRIQRQTGASVAAK